MPDARRVGCCRGSGPASARCTWPRCSPRPPTTRREVPGHDAREHATFLGMPPFPVAARAALADTQLRRNLAHATGTIRAKRAAVVAEVDDWEALRQRAAAIKDDTLAHLDEHLLTLEAALTARGATVHWARDAADACAVVADVAKRARHPRGRQGQVDGDPGDRAQRSPCRAGHLGVGDRPGRADRAAGRRPAQPHPRAGDPPQPLRDPRHLPRPDGRCRAARTGGPDRRPGRAGVAPPGCTCARSSSSTSDGRLRRELRCGGDGHARRRRVRGQRPDVPDPARGARDGGRHREARADLGRPRRVPAPAPALARPGSG